MNEERFVLTDKVWVRLGGVPRPLSRRCIQSQRFECISLPVATEPNDDSNHRWDQ